MTVEAKGHPTIVWSEKIFSSTYFWFCLCFVFQTFSFSLFVKCLPPRTFLVFLHCVWGIISVFVQKWHFFVKNGGFRWSVVHWSPPPPRFMAAGS